MRVALTIAVLVAPVVIVMITVFRATALFASVSRLFDGGEAAVAPVMERVAFSRGSRSVSLILDLDELQAVDSSVAFVRRFLAQRYRNLELLVLCGPRGIPTELGLAFDLVEAGNADGVTVHRSRRDDRLVCVVRLVDDADPTQRWNTALAVASGELVLPLDGRWDLRPIAVAELAAPWVRTPLISAAVGVVHPRVSGRFNTTDLVSARADLMTIAGMGEGPAVRAALGSLASGREGCIIAMFSRAALTRIGGLPGSLADPATWTSLGHRFQVDAENRHAHHDVQVLPQPLGLISSSAIVSAGSVPALSENARAARATRRVISATSWVPVLTGVSLLAAGIGLVTGTVATDVLWVAASAPLLAMTIMVMGLMMDDRSLRPVGSTSARISLLVGTVGAALWGTVGSPLRRPPGKLNRA